MNVVLFVVFRRDSAVIFINKAKIEVKHPRDLGLEIGFAVDDVVVEIKHRRLVKRAMHQLEVVGKLLLDLGPDGDAVVVGRQHGFVGEVGPIVNKGGADGIVAKAGLSINPVFETDQSTQLEVVSLVFVGKDLASQKRRELPVLLVIQLHATVDLKVRLFPFAAGFVLVDDRAVKQLVVEIEGDQAVVPVEGKVVVDVAVVDVA